MAKMETRSEFPYLLHFLVPPQAANFSTANLTVKQCMSKSVAQCQQPDFTSLYLFPSA